MTTSFQADIRPLFTERDIQGMRSGLTADIAETTRMTLAACKRAVCYDSLGDLPGAIHDALR
jgi:hypothetical protein